MPPLHRPPHRELSQLASLLAAARISPAASAAQRQRRHSSSKPSSPASGDALAPSPKDGGGEAAAPRKRAGAAARPAKARRAKGPPQRTKLQQVHDALPSVPATGHLDSQAVTLASFFSLHRPISVTSPVPPAAAADAFNALFRTRGASADAVMTLASAVRVLDRAISSAEDADKPDDADAALSLHDLAANFRPFHPPPVPEPAAAAAEHGVQLRDLLPLVPSESAGAAAPYRLRMRARRAAAAGRAVAAQAAALRATDAGHGWWAISVRRQRKLRMKKHKYKKLRKRQQNERRRLDRL